MAEWKDRWTNRWITGPTNNQTNWQTDKQEGKQTRGQTGKKMDGCMNRQTDEQTDGQMNEQTRRRKNGRTRTYIGCSGFGPSRVHALPWCVAEGLSGLYFPPRMGINRWTSTILEQELRSPMPTFLCAKLALTKAELNNILVRASACASGWRHTLVENVVATINTIIFSSLLFFFSPTPLLFYQKGLSYGREILCVHLLG